MLQYALATGVIFGLYYALVGVGMNLVFGVMRIVNLAHGDFIMLGAFGAFWMLRGLGLPAPAVIAISFAMFFVVGLPVYYLLVPRLFRSREPEMLSLILFFGLSQTIEAGVAMLFGNSERSIPSKLLGGHPVPLLGQTIPYAWAYAACVSVVMLAGVYVYLYRTRLGRQTRAIMAQREEAVAIGVDVHRISAIAFGTGPVLAVVGGGVAALLVGLLLTPLLRLQGAYFGLASLAASEALLHLIANPSLQSVTGGPYGVKLALPYTPGFTYGIALGILVLTMGLVAWLRHSRFGLQLRAARDNPLAALMAGMDIVRGRLVVWLASAVAAGLIGAVSAWRASTFFPEAMFDINFSIFAIVFTLFGGAGTLAGPVLGVLLLYGLYNALGVSAPQYFQLAYGVLIMLLVLFLPEGLASIPRHFAPRGKQAQPSGRPAHV